VSVLLLLQQGVAPLPPPSPLTVDTEPWRFVLTDPLGVAVGEPLATGRQYEPGVSQTETAQFRVRTDTSVWAAIQAGEVMLKIYDSGGSLLYFGEVITDELTGSGQGATVAVSSADLSWRLQKRLVGKDFDGVGVEHIDKDSGQIVFDSLDAINLEQPTGIQKGNKDPFVVRTITLLWKPMLQLLSELGSIESSYEWTPRYVDGTPPDVFLDLKTRVGVDRSATVFFEYGMGKSNCQEFRRVRSMETSATRVYVLGTGQTVVAEAYDSGAEEFRRLEEQLSFGDITTPSMVDALAAAHVAYRARPRVIATFTPFPKLAPIYGQQWTVGDYVTARATISNVLVTDGIARVWGASISLDELGNEIAVPRVEPNAG